MHVFDGIKFSQERELVLKDRVAHDFGGDGRKQLKISAILFIEDFGSQIYTKLKSEAAVRVGIEYEVHSFSLSDDSSKIISKINELNEDSDVSGIIIQKPWRKTWVNEQEEDFSKLSLQANDPQKFEREKYASWWSSLTSKISEKKDVDGLHPNTIAQIKAGTWKENKKVLPATCKAVLTILDRAGETENFSDEKTIIIGKSDLLGIPLYYELLRCSGDQSRGKKTKNKQIELIASKELKERMASGQKLLDANVIISATGRKNLITGGMVSPSVVVIDVGEPSGDVDFVSVSPKTSFITPVPGGVGPMTVISLLENCVDLASMVQGVPQGYT